MNAPERAAVYSIRGSALTACARLAESYGLRVVTMVDEDLPAQALPLAGDRLSRLIDRLGNGEFEIIVADAGSGRVVTIAAAPDEVAAPVPRVRCAIYVRCASPSQATPYPLADQWDACEAYAAKQGWETVAVYKDNAGSGRKWSRASFDAMMAQAERGAFDVVLVKDLDRLSRDAAHLHLLLADLKALGVAVHTVYGGEVSEALEASLRRPMVMRSIKETTAKKRLGCDRKLRSSRAETTTQQVVL